MSAGGGPQADRLRVLLTGAAGYIGSHVHQALRAAGHEVVAIDALLDSAHDLNTTLPHDVSLVDIRNPEALDALLPGIDVVCHLAAAVPVPDFPEPPARPARRGAPHAHSGLPGPESRGSGPATGSNPFARVSRSTGDPATGPSAAGSPEDGDGSRDAGKTAGARGIAGRGADGPTDSGQPAAADENAREDAGGDQSREARRDDLGHGAGPCVRGPSRDAERSAGAGVIPTEGERVVGAAATPTGAERAVGSGAAEAGMRRAALYASHNDAGTAVLLAAMEKAGVGRLVLASSVAVYGEGRYRGVRSGPFFPGLRRRADLDRGLFDHRAPRTGELLTWEPVGEDAPLRPRSAYAASKVAQEHYALAWATGTGSAVTVLRYHHVYGDPAAGIRSRSAASGLAARFRAESAAGRAPRLFEDGGQMRDFVHVRDIASATLAAVERALPGFVPLNIASGRPLTLWEVASIMSKTLGAPDPVVTGQYRITDIRHLVANSERARGALDFTPRIAPARGLADYAVRAR
ncbi:NAD-dependent epimerase/dehydratase family protein [Nocardia sp. NPDC088792]|uniref:NAD-dependent epimerase/dehydratase family protein n=1 Tax=Nocardia sp. NPDC088792 TaxID=3364332 RepID=UPI003810B701